MATINLDGNSSGKQIRVAANDIIEIILDEVPTTGYRWVISQLNPDHLQVLNEEFDLYSTAGIGGGGVKKIQLQVKETGAGTVQLQNMQPWSGDVDQTFEFSYS